MWTQCTGLFTYNSETVVCGDFSLLIPPAIISNPVNTLFQTIAQYTSRVSLSGPGLILHKPGNISNLCSTGSEFNFWLTEFLTPNENLCMNSHVLYSTDLILTHHLCHFYRSIQSALQNHILRTQLKAYCVISTQWLINYIHTLYVIDIYRDI